MSTPGTSSDACSTSASANTTTSTTTTSTNKAEHNDDDVDMEDDDSDEYSYECDYYTTGPADDDNEPKDEEPEHLPCICLTQEQVERMLNQSVDLLQHQASLTPSLAKVMLHAFNWNAQDLIQKYKENSTEVLIQCRVKPKAGNSSRQVAISDSCSTCSTSESMCTVCTQVTVPDKYSALACGHSFCNDCWAMHFEVKILQGVSTGIGCMASGCEIRVPEDFVLTLVHKPSLRDRYQQFCFQDYVKSHPQLRYCPGPNCQVVVQAKITRNGRVICGSCNTQWCFKCGGPPHAPADCSLIKRWLTKCADDTETANYISAHTKDCPTCQICIEKNGGCNHMQCFACHHEFCWMCLGEWKFHGSEYYECSRYKVNPNIAHNSQLAQAREALKKYLHYYQRWENHAKSLRLEQETLEQLRQRINQKVAGGAGTWIDWQHLFDGASLLARCRHTLQYTYPFAYYMEAGPRKDLFEYQQAQLEAEIENLSWKIERAETTDKGDLQNQMDVAEKRRLTLLKDFLEL